MGPDLKDVAVFRVSRGKNSEWNVGEQGLDKPLASFDSEEVACTYASGLAGARQGSRVVVEARKLVGTLHLPRSSKS